MFIRKTHKQYVEQLCLVLSDVFPLEDYNGVNTKILHKCKCGTVWNISPEQLLTKKKRMCNECNRFKTHSQYLTDLKDTKIATAPLEKYQGSNVKILHKCECGSEWNVAPNSVLAHHKCKMCSSNRLKTHNEYVDELKQKHINVIPVEQYASSAIAILHKCKCSNIWKITPNDVLRNVKCSICTTQRARLQTANTTENFTERSVEVHGNLYDYSLVEYYNTKTKVTIKCNTCKGIFEQIPNSHLSGHGCPLCKDVQRFKNKKTYLYYISINGEQYKIGITKSRGTVEKSIHKRYINEKTTNIKILDYVLFDDGADALKAEQAIIFKYKKYIIDRNDILLTNGHTETFHCNVLESKLTDYKRGINDN